MTYTELKARKSFYRDAFVAGVITSLEYQAFISALNAIAVNRVLYYVEDIDTGETYAAFEVEKFALHAMRLLNAVAENNRTFVVRQVVETRC